MRAHLVMLCHSLGMRAGTAAVFFVMGANFRCFQNQIQHHVGNTCDACGIFVPWPPPKSMRAGELKGELLSFGSLGVETPA